MPRRSTRTNSPAAGHRPGRGCCASKTVNNSAQFEESFMRNSVSLVAGVLAALGTVVISAQIGGVPAGGGRGRAGGPPAPPVNLPAAPTAVALPALSSEINGPGAMFDSSPSLAPGKGMDAFAYQA